MMENEYEAAYEDEFRAKVEEIAYYQGGHKRTTLDGEWTEEDLKDDVWDEANKYLNGTKDTEGWLNKNKYRAMMDPDLCKVAYLVENICDRYDLIEVYNKALDLHRDDENKLFGIVYFDQLARAEIKKTLKNNLVTE